MKLPPQTLAAAVVLHLAVLGLLLSGVQCRQKIETPQPIAAVLIDADSLPKARSRSIATAQPVPEAKPVPVQEPQPDPLPPPEPAQEPVKPKPAPVKPEPKPEVKPEPKPEPKPDLIAQQAADAKLKAQKKAEADAARQAALEVSEAAASEDLKNLARKEENERRRQREAADAKAQEEALQAQIAAEAGEQKAASASRIATSRDAWGAAIRRAIKSNYTRPPSSVDNFVCSLQVNISPAGVVLSARIVKSCGSGPLDDSVLRAVYKSDPLPVPSEPEAFLPTLTFNFTP